MAAKKKYDWEGWFERLLFRLTRGEHYRCSTASMIQQLYNWCWANNRHASVVERSKDGLTVLVLKQGEGTKFNRRPAKGETR